MSTLQSSFPLRQRPAAKVQTSWWGQWLWVLGAALLSWACAAFFAGVLHWPRPLFLAPYVLLAGGFLLAWLRWGGVDWRHELTRNWGWGLLAALVVGAFVVRNVLQQPRTPMPQGMDLVFTLLWLGLVYGLVDSLLLSVLPIAATWQACTRLGWTERWPGQMATSGLALLASLVVTVAYHLGYPEFQGLAVLGPVVGVGVMSIAYLFSRSPLAPVLSHIAMHVAAVLYGLATAIQLPPHY